MFYKHLTSLLRQGPGWIARSAFDKNTLTLLRHRDALGDVLMLTPLVRGLKEALPDRRVAVATQRSDIFTHNPHVDECRDWHLWRTKRTMRGHYGPEDLNNLEHVVEAQWCNLWEELLEAGVTDVEEPPDLSGVHPELFLTDDEKARGRDGLLAATPLALRGRPVILMASGGKRKPVHNREWGLENYQALVDALAPDTIVIQVGGDEALRFGDRRLVNLGKRPVRETAALFAAADAVLLQEGGLHHLARAVEAPSVVIFGGSVLPEQTGYDKQLNLSEQTDCSPCLGRRQNCPHMKCMASFSPRRVAEAISYVLDDRGKTLPNEAIDRAPEHWTPPPFIDRDQHADALEADENRKQRKETKQSRRVKQPEDSKRVERTEESKRAKRTEESKRVKKPEPSKRTKPTRER